MDRLWTHVRGFFGTQAEKKRSSHYRTWATYLLGVTEKLMPLFCSLHDEIDDLTLYALGLESKETIDALFDAVKNKEELDIQQKSWSYEELMEMEFRVILNSDCYIPDENTGLYTDLRSTDAGLRYLYENAMKLKVTGIIRPSEKAAATMLNGSIGYTKALTELVVEKAKDSAAIREQNKNSKMQSI